MKRYLFLLRERLADFREWVEGRRPGRFELTLMACMAIALAVIISTAYVPALRGFNVGQPAPRTIVAGKTVTVMDAQATEDLKAQVAAVVEPVYKADPTVLPKATADLDGFLQQAETLRGKVASNGLAKVLTELQASAPSSVSAATLEYLLSSDQATFAQIEAQCLGALKSLYAGRITEGSLDAALLNLRAIADALAVSTSTADAVYEVAAGYIRPDQVVDEAPTQIRKQEAMDQVAPVTLTVTKGETVVEKGQTLTNQHMLVLAALGLTESRSGWRVWLGIFLIALLETALFSRLLRRFNKSTEGYGNNMLLALVLLLIGGTGTARLLIIHPLSGYMVPVAALGMTVAVILNARSALLSVALLSLNIGMITDFQLRYALVALIVGALSLYLVSRVTKRAALMAAGLATMFLAAFMIFAAELANGSSAGTALSTCVWGFANGFLAGVLTIVLIVILENVFNLTTPLRLLELADPAHPLLKKLLQVAPGTYNHSIQMGNLAEAAAETIGANPLLARVGAYYHDIGKTVRPDYFVENQIYVDNPHDHLTPSLSRLAITAHVRDGEHLAKLYGLPQPVVDIIKQHHGTSVLAYFYHRAKASSEGPVYEESFRYEEQKPRSKEAAIIMLADSVEAAVRAMENPTRRKLQGVIQEIMKQKIQDGQLDESALTQGDLHRIQESFDVSLLGLVGHRIRYPDREDRPVHGGLHGPGGPGGAGPGSPEPAPRRPSRPPSATARRPNGSASGRPDGTSSGQTGQGGTPSGGGGTSGGQGGTPGAGGGTPGAGR